MCSFHPHMPPPPPAPPKVASLDEVQNKNGTISKLKQTSWHDQTIVTGNQGLSGSSGSGGLSHKAAEGSLGGTLGGSSGGLTEGLAGKWSQNSARGVGSSPRGASLLGD